MSDGDPSVAEAHPELVQLLSPEGERVAHPHYSIDLTPDEFRALYRDLVLVRRIDIEATALQRQGELGIWASLLGQEAAQVGSGRALAPDDFVFPTYREHGVAWCRDVDPLWLLGLFRGVNLGGWDPNAHNFNLYTIVIGSQTLHATGYAMGIQREGGGPDGSYPGAVIAYFGDGASSQGDVNESFVWASVFNAPVVFFCQNNQWAISVPLSGQTASENIAVKATAYGFEGVQVDGNDILAVTQVTQMAVEKARKGGGPTLIEAVTYRMGSHSSSDDPTRYRDSKEVEEWQRRDPIKRFRSYLDSLGLWNEQKEATLKEKFDEEISQAIKIVEAAPPPLRESLFEDVYAGLSPRLAEQAADLNRISESSH